MAFQAYDNPYKVYNPMILQQAFFFLVLNRYNQSSIMLAVFITQSQEKTIVSIHPIMTHFQETLKYTHNYLNKQCIVVRIVDIHSWLDLCCLEIFKPWYSSLKNISIILYPKVATIASHSSIDRSGPQMISHLVLLVSNRFKPGTTVKRFPLQSCKTLNASQSSDTKPFV